MSDDPDTWQYYFYYMYLEGRGAQFIFGTHDEVAAMAESEPDNIFFISQEEIYPMWIRIDDEWYRVGPADGEDTYRYYYVKYFEGEPRLMITATHNEIAEFAEDNKALVVFGSNEALDKEHTLVARSTMARETPTE